MKVAGLLCAVVLAAVLTACGGAGQFDPDPFFRIGPISDTASHQILKLDHIASTLAGKRTIVKCWSNKRWAQLQAWEGSHHDTPAVDAAGITYVRYRDIELSPVVCQILKQVLDRSARQPLFTAWAVHVLAHESAHASGIEAENRAECRAIKTDPRAAELFGFSKASASPDGANVLFSNTTLKTKRDFSVALARFKAHPRCSLGLFQTHLREIDSPGRASLHALPHEITRLSPTISGFRIRLGNGAIRVNNDLITIVDPAKRPSRVSTSRPARP